MVPKGWYRKSLCEIAEINPRKPDRPNDGVVSFIPMDAVSENAAILRLEERCYEDVEKGFTSFKDKDVLVAKITPCFENGKGAIAEGLTNGIGFGSTEFHVLRATPDTSPNFIYYLTNTEQFRIKGEANMQGSAGQKRVTTDYLKILKVLVPPFPEQCKIAQILSTWDKAITTTERLLTNRQQQKKALMQRLLTGKQRFAGFEGEWETRQLDNICHINPSKISAPRNGLVSFIPMDAVSEEAKLLRFEERQYSEVEKGFTSFIDNDVLIAKITPCFENGKGALVSQLINGIGFGSTEFHVLRAKAGFSALFIYYISNSREFRIRGEANMQGSAGQKRVTTDYLRSYKVLIPPTLDEQQKIASVLSTADAEITTFQNQLDNLKQQKKALMQQLLTGKRCVKVDNPALATQ